MTKLILYLTNMIYIRLCILVLYNDCSQLIILLSRTCIIANTIFASSKKDTINALKKLLIIYKQWCDYIQDIINIITIKSEENRFNQ